MTWQVYASLLLALCGVALTVNTGDLECCTCGEMLPQNRGTKRPQIMPSPFRILVDPEMIRYTVGVMPVDIPLTLETVSDEEHSFNMFMIQARRVNSSQNIVEAIGHFEVLDRSKVQAVKKCVNKIGSALASTDNKARKNVELVWHPPKTVQGDIEFRATFIENENEFWVKEKSRIVYDPRSIIPFVPPRYAKPPIPPIDVTLCGQAKGCYRIPEDCQEVGCEYLITWDNQENYVQFEMSAMTDGFNDRFVALGLSEDIYMGKDFVFECVHNSTNGTVEVHQSYNKEDEHVNERFPSQAGIVDADGSFHDGRLRCRFKRLKNVNDVMIGDFPLTSQPHHLLVARGTAWRGKLVKHAFSVGHLPVATPDVVDLRGYDDISGAARYHMVKAHACLMLLAWIFFAPVGLIWMKYFTTMWPNRRFMGERYWFVAHYNCTAWVVLLVIIAIILIFVEVDGYSDFPDLPGRAHPILGIIVFVCVLFIPIILLLRCGEEHTCRPVCNWFYWLFWTIAFCLAIPNIFIGMEFGKANVPWWLTWILCVFFIFNLICEVLLEVHQCYTHKKNKERRKRWELQKKENPNVYIPEPHPAGRIFKRNVLVTHFIVALIVVLISVITVAAS